MKGLFAILMFGLLIASSTQVEAAKPAKKKAHAAKSSAKGKKAKAQSTEELKTSFNFDDHSLHGQYQTPDEALAKVENEKGLSDLLGVRKHFKDRLTESAEQE